MQILNPEPAVNLLKSEFEIALLLIPGLFHRCDASGVKGVFQPDVVIRHSFALKDVRSVDMEQVCVILRLQAIVLTLFRFRVRRIVFGMGGGPWAFRCGAFLILQVELRFSGRAVHLRQRPAVLLRLLLQGVVLGLWFRRFCGFWVLGGGLRC